MINHLLKFYLILKEKLWGGNKLRLLLNKESKSTSLGESRENNVLIISNG